MEFKGGPLDVKNTKYPYLFRALVLDCSGMFATLFLRSYLRLPIRFPAVGQALASGALYYIEAGRVAHASRVLLAGSF
jgi:hypothetical protein